MYQPGKTLYQIEKESIIECLKYFEGNKTAAAESLGIAVKTLYNRLEAFRADSLNEEKEKIKRNQQIQEDLAFARGDTNANNGPKTETGLPVQPTQQPAKKQVVSVRERKEV